MPGRIPTAVNRRVSETSWLLLAHELPTSKSPPLQFARRETRPGGESGHPEADSEEPGQRTTVVPRWKRLGFQGDSRPEGYPIPLWNLFGIPVWSPAPGRRPPGNATPARARRRTALTAPLALPVTPRSRPGHRPALRPAPEADRPPRAELGYAVAPPDFRLDLVGGNLNRSADTTPRPVAGRAVRPAAGGDRSRPQSR